MEPRRLQERLSAIRTSPSTARCPAGIIRRQQAEACEPGAISSPETWPRGPSSSRLEVELHADARANADGAERHRCRQLTARDDDVDLRRASIAPGAPPVPSA